MRPAEHSELTALQQALERAELAQAAGGIGIYDYDIAADRIVWDSRVYALWGLPEGTPVTYQTFASGIHPDDAATVEAAVAAALDPRGDSTCRAAYRVRNQLTGAVCMVEARGHARFRDGAAVRLVGTVRDITKEEELRQELRQANQFAQGLIQTAPTLLYIYDLVEQKNVYIGPQIVPVTGMAPENYRAFGSELLPLVVHPDDLARVQAHHASIREGRSREPFEIEYRLRRADGSWVWLASLEVVHARDEDGRPTQILGASLDISRRHEADEIRQLLVHELGHRIKNAFAMVRSIAALSLRPNCDPAAWEAFEGRLGALASAHATIPATPGAPVDLHSTVVQAIQPFASYPLQVDGPDCRILPAIADILPLLLHELATNAVKYGAWSVPGGRVELTWQCDPQQVDLCWEEIGGPPVAAPRGKGFGTRLLESALLSQNGRLDLHFFAEGLQCRMAFPREQD
jgi:PAS domain S-box-containing protein